MKGFSMKLLAINGSPRKGGNTEILLKEVLKSAKSQGVEVEFIQVGGSDIKPCRACFGCASKKDNKCVFNDDCFNEIMAKMLDADAFVLGSPSYFSAMTPELKSLIDRAGFVAYINDGLFKHKIGAAVCAQRRGGGTSVMESINYMFLMSEMFVAGSTYWNFANGMEKGEVLNDAEGIANMHNLGENIAWLLEKIKK